MSDLNAIADRLFPSSVPSTPAADTTNTPAPVVESNAAAEPAAQTEPAKPAAQTLASAPTLAELRDDPLRRLFSPQKTYGAVQVESAMESSTAAPEVKLAAAGEIREILADCGASGVDAHELVDAATRFSSEPMTPERDASNVNDAIGALNREFGTDAKSALRAAQEMVLRNPRLARALDESRLGNDPQTVLKLARLARSAKART